jgi:uncharacterized membrane protein
MDLGESINNGTEWLTQSPLVRQVAGNPIATSLLLTTLVLVIVYAVFRAELSGTPWNRWVKAGFWIAAGTCALTFIHYYVVRGEMENTESKVAIRNLVSSVHSGIVGGLDDAHHLVSEAARPNNVRPPVFGTVWDGQADLEPVIPPGTRK